MRSRIFAIVFLLSVGAVLWSAARPPAPRTLTIRVPGRGYYTIVPRRSSHATCFSITWKHGAKPTVTPCGQPTAGGSSGIDVVVP